MEVEGGEAIWPRPCGKYGAELRFEPKTVLFQALLPHVPPLQSKPPKALSTIPASGLASAVPPARRLERGGPTWIPAWLNLTVCPQTGAVCLLSPPCKLNLALG